MNNLTMVAAMALLVSASTAFADTTLRNFDRYVSRLETQCGVVATQTGVISVEVVCGNGMFGNCSGGSSEGSSFNCSVMGNYRNGEVVSGLDQAIGWVFANLGDEVQAPNLPQSVRLPANALYSLSWETMDIDSNETAVRNLNIAMTQHGMSEYRRLGRGGTFDVVDLYEDGRVHPFWKLRDSQGTIFYTYVESGL